VEHLDKILYSGFSSLVGAPSTGKDGEMPCIIKKHWERKLIRDEPGLLCRKKNDQTIIGVWPPKCLEKRVNTNLKMYHLHPSSKSVSWVQLQGG